MALKLHSQTKEPEICGSISAHQHGIKRNFAPSHSGPLSRQRLALQQAICHAFPLPHRRDPKPLLGHCPHEIRQLHGTLVARSLQRQKSPHVQPIRPNNSLSTTKSTRFAPLTGGVVCARCTRSGTVKLTESGMGSEGPT